MKSESKILEYKQEMTATYLKTVSAYANYCGGEIVFGITDSGIIKPIKETQKFALDIENQINDSFQTRPPFEIQINQNGTIVLKIFKGLNTPYLYKGKAYKRSNTATVEVDQIELKRLILQGENLSFDELETNEGNLLFTLLEKKMCESLKIEKLNNDVLITLNLLKNGKYNNAACLMADVNGFPGLDIVVFGDSIDIFKERKTLSNISLIKQFCEAMELYERYYSFEIVDGVERRNVEKIPKIAFREIISNAIVHRTYDIKSNTKISMFPDRIEICSPGGLPTGMSEEKFEEGTISISRNPIISNVFRRINLVEAFATGIRRANSEYMKTDKKITYKIDENFVFVSLPVIDAKNKDAKYDKYLNLLSDHIKYSRVDLEKILGIQKDSLIRLLNAMLDKKLIAKEGNGKNTKYFKI